MNRPTLGMACIMRNEAHNIFPMLQSVKGCFDQIVIVDTGSTDASVSILEEINKKIVDQDPEWIGYPVIEIEHFEWIDDFSAAREYAFSFLKTDYGFWLDLDDSLSNADAFIHWRNTVMHAAHYWIAIYNYAFDKDGNVACQFIRERVVKLNYGFKWQYFVHEGLMNVEGRQFWTQRVNSWWINHRRTEEDRKRDYKRNIDIIKKYQDKGELHPRMNFYLGKEMQENGFHKEACEPLLKAIGAKELEPHDRVLAIQYAIDSAVSCEAWGQALELIFNGIKLKPNRAEYWCQLGDLYLRHNQISDAIQSFKVALNSQKDEMGGAVVCFDHAYSTHPKLKLAEINLKIGQYDEAKFWIDSLKDSHHPAVSQLENEYWRLIDLSTIKRGQTKTDDVLITCPPNGAVTDWDEFTLKEKGHGGSETAAIEVAKWIHIKTGRKVKLFQTRKKMDVMPSGVEYIPVSELNGYLKNIEPYAHIAWRHSTRLTHANSFVWCHDLQMPGGNLAHNYEKLVALSEFHKNYLIETNGVPPEKIVLGFNGINPDDFPKDEIQKDPLKVVFSSSPDRGLVQAIDIVKLAREKSGLDIKLHCFYGTDNMRKMGQHEWANAIEKKIFENESFVVYHGMVPKSDLMRHFKESAVWLYVNDFIETYCITAIEAMCAGTWPIVRPIAALPYTMKEAIEKECCDLVKQEAKEEKDQNIWADVLIDAIKQEKWRKMDFSLNNYSWEKVANFFIKEMNL